MFLYRLLFFFIGIFIVSLGNGLAIKMNYLGPHPWDVLSLGLFYVFGLSVGTWIIVMGIVMIIVTLFLDFTYIKFGTLLNVFLIGLLIDFYLWADLLPDPTNLPFDIFIMIIAIIIVGIGGGLYNAAELGSGPRDGFMLSISEKTGYSIGRVRISVELIALIIGLIIGGPISIFTFIFPFIQSPVFAYSYFRFSRMANQHQRTFNN